MISVDEVIDADAAPGSKTSRRVHLGIIFGAFAASRVALWIGGVRFEPSFFGGDQLLDLTVLRADPFQAFTHNHIQPPLWNYFVGAVLRWSPFPDDVSFLSLFVVADLITLVALWWLLEGLGARRWSATVATILVGWSPLMIANEHSLQYETIMTTLIVLACLTFLRYLRDPGPLRLALFALVLVVGVLTRTTLHPLWMIAGLALALGATWARTRRRASGGVVLVALLLVGVPLAHRAVTYGVSGFSSYWPMNLERITVMNYPPEQIDELIADGTVSPMAAVPPLGKYEDYAPHVPECNPDTGVEVLDQFFKSDGRRNLNNICFLDVYRQAGSDALYTIRADPLRYLQVVGRSSVIYSSIGSYADQPGTGLETWSAVYDPLFLPVHLDYSWGSGIPEERKSVFDRLVGGDPLSITVLASYVVCGFFTVRGLGRWVRRRAGHADVTWVFVGLSVVLISIPNVMMETFENARFRTPLDPILLGPLYVLVLEAAGRTLVRAKRRFTARRIGDSK